MLRDARVAVSFLTRIPADTGDTLDAQALSRAAMWFPAVGVLVGAVVGGTRLAAEQILPAEPATVLALTAGILLTGGFHEDGIADIADGVGAHVSRERKLEILRDSRVGTFGSLAVVLPLLLAFACLAPLDGDQMLVAAICAHTLGRWSVLPHSRLAAPARTDGSGSLVRATALGLVITTAFVGAIAAGLAGPADGAVFAAVAIITTLLGGLGLIRVLGGVTGDSYGAVNKLVEIAVYGAAAALWLGGS